MRKYLYFIIVAAVMTACETDVTDKVKTDAYDGAALLSVGGSVTDLVGTGTYVDLAINSPYLEIGAPATISGGIVEVYENDSLVSTLTEVSPGPSEDTALVATIGYKYRLLIDVPAGYGDATGLWESTTDVVNTPFTLLAPMFPIMEDDSSWIDFRTGIPYGTQMQIPVTTALMLCGTILSEKETRIG